MAVYVDDMHKTNMGNYGRMKMSHMIADTVQELHDMAKKIGIDKKHYQGPPKTTNPHYDICKAKRELAINNGAIEITMRESLVILRKMRKQAILDYKNGIR